MDSTCVILQKVGNGVYHRSGIVFIAKDDISNIIGQNLGSYYASAVVKRHVALEIPWPDLDWCEDSKFCQALEAKYKNAVKKSMDCYYVIRRHNNDRQVL